MTRSIRTSISSLAFIALLVLGGEVHAQATDVQCDQCVDTSDLAPDAVSANKIANNAVRSEHIKKNAVGTSELAKNAVTSAKIKSGAVKSSDLASNSVNTNKIQDGAVTVEKVAPELSNSIDSSCPGGQAVTGKDAEGNFICGGAGGQTMVQGGYDLSLGTIDGPDPADFFLGSSIGTGNTTLDLNGGENVLVIASARLYKDPADTSGSDVIHGSFNACYRDNSDNSVVVPCFNDGGEGCWHGVTPVCFVSTGEDDETPASTSYLFQNMPAGNFEFGICASTSNFGGCSDETVTANFAISGHKIAVISGN